MNFTRTATLLILAAVLLWSSNCVGDNIKATKTDYKAKLGELRKNTFVQRSVGLTIIHPNFFVQGFGKEVQFYDIAANMPRATGDKLGPFSYRQKGGSPPYFVAANITYKSWRETRFYDSYFAPVSDDKVKKFVKYVGNRIFENRAGINPKAEPVIYKVFKGSLSQNLYCVSGDVVEGEEGNTEKVVFYACSVAAGHMLVTAAGSFLTKDIPALVNGHSLYQKDITQDDINDAFYRLVVLPLETSEFTGKPIPKK